MSEVSVSNVPVPMVPVEVVVREPFDTLYHREFAGLVRLAMVLVDNQLKRYGPEARTAFRTPSPRCT